MSITAISKSGLEGVKGKSLTPIYNLGVIDVDFLVIAGGGGGGSGNYRDNSGGGGAGGYRNSYNSESSGLQARLKDLTVPLKIVHDLVFE